MEINQAPSWVSTYWQCKVWTWSCKMSLLDLSPFLSFPPTTPYGTQSTSPYSTATAAASSVDLIISPIPSELEQLTNPEGCQAKDVIVLNSVLACWTNKTSGTRRHALLAKISFSFSKSHNDSTVLHHNLGVNQEEWHAPYESKWRSEVRHMQSYLKDSKAPIHAAKSLLHTNWLLCLFTSTVQTLCVFVAYIMTALTMCMCVYMCVLNEWLNNASIMCRHTNAAALKKWHTVSTFACLLCAFAFTLKLRCCYYIYIFSVMCVNDVYLGVLWFSEFDFQAKFQQR